MELYTMSYNNLMEKNLKKDYVCVCIYMYNIYIYIFCNIPETNTTLYINYSSIKRKKKGVN